MKKDNPKNPKKSQGPILYETKPFDCPLDLRKLPGIYKRITAYITKDRDTEFESEIIVKWANRIVYKTSDIDMYDEIKDKIEMKAFKFNIRANKIELIFTESPQYKGNDKRKSIDRRSGGDRRE